MDKKIAGYVIDCVKPPYLSGYGPAGEIPRPEFPEVPEFLMKRGPWNRAIELSERLHCAAPFLAGVARASWFGELDEGIRLRVEERLARERMLLAILSEEAETAIGILGSHRIPVIVLKGMDLGSRVYPDRILRPMADADLLVAPERYREALALLGKHGYRVSGPNVLNRFRIELSRRPGLPTIELHSRLLQVDDDEFLARVWANSADGRLPPGMPRPARVIGDTEQIIYLLQHGAVQHLLESPVWLNDIHLLIEDCVRQERPVDWEYVQWSLARVRALSAATLVLGILREDWGTSIPSEVFARVRGEIDPLRRVLLHRLGRSGRWFGDGHRSWSWVIRSRFLLRDGLMEAARHAYRRQQSASAAESLPAR